MRFFNCTLEQKDWQCDCFQFSFKPRSILNVPERISWIAKDELKEYGIIPLDGLDKNTFAEAERAALLDYLQNNIKRRIMNFDSYYEDLRRTGVTFEKNDPLYLKLLRWEKELSHKLNMERPIDVELSYLTKEEREKIGVDGEKFFNFEEKNEVEKLKKNGMHFNLFDGFKSANIIDFTQPDEFIPPDVQLQNPSEYTAEKAQKIRRRREATQSEG